MKIYHLMSALLQYPEPELIAALPTFTPLLGEHDAALAVLLDHLCATPLIDLQQQYVATFDRNPALSLHLFEHIHGESRDRGQAMVDLMAEYRRHGLQMVGDDLPDYVPLFLEFLGQQQAAEAGRLLGDAVHVLAHLGRKLRSAGSPYACVFALLERLSPVAAEELSEPPVRDMDEALETFGPGADGVEPLLRNIAGAGGTAGAVGTSAVGTMWGAAQPINFYPRAAAARH